MAETDVPKWGVGLAPKINAVDASFVKYFPTCDSAPISSSGVDANTNSWSASLAVPIPRTRLPAWSRVAIQPHSSTHFVGLIMKRVGLSTPRTIVNAHIIAQKEPAKTNLELEVDESEQRRIRRRVQKHEPTLEEAKFEGKPCTRAEAAALLMQAKVDASNNFMTTSSETSFEEKLKSRTGAYVKVCPTKRYYGTDIPTQNDPVGGNKLPIYRDVLPIIVRAVRKGMDEVDYTTASIAEASAIMQRVRRSRNPRQRVAIHGIPELSDINDETEPESSYMMKPPTLKAESRSPQKRIAKLTSPVKKSFRRLSNSLIKLIPGSSPKAEPSPSKSASTPSTPLRLSPTPSKTASSAPIDSSPLSRAVADASEHAIEDSPGRPGRTFAVPDNTTDFSSMSMSRSAITAPEYFATDIGGAKSSPASVSAGLMFGELSNTNQTHQISSPAKVSPNKYDRPVAPTPSRWNREEPSTPQIFTPAPVRQADSPLGLASLVPLTPTVDKCPYQSETDAAQAHFRFGTMSPSFSNSISWINNSVEASEPRRIQNVNKARRRQSEPIIRKYWETQARRRTLSPRKVTFQDEDSLFETGSITSLLPSLHSEAIDSVNPAKLTLSDPDVDSNSTQEDEDSQISYAPTLEDGVLNIDMRQNQDIFHASVSQLADIAQDRCSGHAKVVVTEENGRLFVRFKLSAEHAWMFPQSQGFNESRFASSPLVSRSPRLRFNPQPSTFAQCQTTPGTATSLRSLIHPSPAIGRFSDQSPLAREPGSDLGSLLDTPSMSVQYGTPTMIMAEDYPQVPNSTVKRTPLTRASRESTSNFDSLLETPSMSVYYATPTMIMADDATPTVSQSITQRTPTLRSRGFVQSTPIDQTPKVSAVGNKDHLMSDALPCTKSLSLLAHTMAQNTKQETPSKPADDTRSIVTEEPTPLKTATDCMSTPAQKQTPTVVEEDETVPASTEKHTPVQPINDLLPDISQEQTLANSTPATNAQSAVLDMTPTTSFTPVNKTSPRIQTTTPSDVQATYKSTPVQQKAEEEPAASTNPQQEIYDDSPGRKYIHEFIKRSRRTSTTETGSPIAPPTKRQPLVAKSPNTPSPQKKRKLQKDEAESPAKKQKKEEDESKVPGRKTRRTAKSSRRQPEPAVNMAEDPVPVADATVQETAKADEQDGEEHDAPLARRSSRLRSTRASSAPKSSIPTAIKLGRSGAGRGTVLNSTVRSDQQELTAQTRANTRKNKGNAEYPAQVLVRVAEAAKEDSDESDAPSSGSNVSAGRKSVVWKEPLEEAQEAQPVKGRAATKAKATQGTSGIAKPKARVSASKSRQTAKVAESLGMVANGTPARPQRMTRSQTRSRS